MEVFYDVGEVVGQGIGESYALERKVDERFAKCLDVADEEEIAIKVDALDEVMFHLDGYKEVADAVDTSFTCEVVGWIVAVDERLGEVRSLDVVYGT